MIKIAQTKFQKQVSKILDRSYIEDKLQISWISGGYTGGNLWGDIAATPFK